MYKSINLASILSILLFFAIGNLVNAQKLKGNGNVVKQVTEVKAFTQLSLNGVFNSTLIQGDKSQVVIETDENLLEAIEILIDGDHLIIQSKEGLKIKKSTALNVYVTFPYLSELEIAGVGNVRTETMLTFSDAFKVNVEGVGNVTLPLTCAELNAHFSAVGNIELAGEVQQATIKNYGVGNVRAFNLKVQDLNFEHAGIGSVKIYATHSLSIQSSGIGRVEYKGDAQVKDLNVRGIGKVRKL